MGVRNIVVLMLAFACSGLLTGCRSSSSHFTPVYRPPWVVDPKRADSVYFYVVGSATRQPSAVAAREAAFQNALHQISLQIANEAGLGPAVLPPGGVFTPLKGAEILPDCVHIEPHYGHYNGFVQVSFPITEKRNIVEQLRSE